MLEKEKSLTDWESIRDLLLFRTPAGGRTLDTLIKSQVLYQLSYGSIVVLWVQKYNLFSYQSQFLQTFFHDILQIIEYQFIINNYFFFEY